MGRSSLIVKNTGILYIRMAFALIINLLTVRFVYRGLGGEDYGIFTVITGFVVMFQSFSNVLTTSIQRFYSYAIGKKNDSYISDIYTACLRLYFAVSIVIVIIAETIGLWFINYKLQLPIQSLFASNLLYQFSIFTFIFTLFQTLYSSVIIAYENMHFFAFISIFDCVLKFIAALFIGNLMSHRLEFYGAFLLVISGIITAIYIYVVRIRYKLCHVCKIENRFIYRKLLSFSGWHLFSSTASVGMIQINTILVNMFFGVIVNAARGIALQINSAMTSFSSSFTMAIRPPMIKAYAERNYDQLNKMFDLSNKIIYYLMLVIAVPLYLEIEYILNWWLGQTDAYMISFSKIVVVYAVILSLNNPISIIVQATGQLKQYFLYVEAFTLLCPVATYILFKLGYPPQATFYAMVGAITCAHIVRLFCLKNIYAEFEIRNYFFDFVLKAVIITILTCLVTTYVKHIGGNILLVCLSNLIVIIASCYIFAMSKSDKDSLNGIIKSKLKIKH